MIQVSNYFLIVCLLLYMHLDCFLVLLPYMHIYLLPYMHMLLLYGVAIPPPLLSLMPFVKCEQVTGLRQILLRFSCALQSAHVPELEPDVIPDI
jgi:hypothetical protein